MSSLQYGGFRKFGGTPSHHPFQIGIVHEINKPFWGTLMTMETPHLAKRNPHGTLDRYIGYLHMMLPPGLDGGFHSHGGTPKMDGLYRAKPYKNG